MMCPFVECSNNKGKSKMCMVIECQKRTCVKHGCSVFNQSLHLVFFCFFFFVFFTLTSCTHSSVAFDCLFDFSCKLFWMQKFNVNASAVRLQAYQDLNFFYTLFFSLSLFVLRLWKLSERLKMCGANLFNHFCMVSSFEIQLA